MFHDRRAIYIVTGALLTTLVVTTGSLMTYFLIQPQIKKGVDRNNLDVVRNALTDLDLHIRGLLAKGPNTTSIFSMTLPEGVVRADPKEDILSYSIKTKVSYDPGSTSSLSATKTANDLLTMRSSLPVDLVTKNTKIMPGQYIVKLTFEKEVRIRISNWTLYKNTTFPGTVSSTTHNYYVSVLKESSRGADINRDGDKNDTWTLYLSDPDEDYVFDSVAIHDSNGDQIKTVKEGDALRLGDVPLMVYRVRERYVVLRYARIRMELK